MKDSFDDLKRLSSDHIRILKIELIDFIHYELTKIATSIKTTPEILSSKIIGDYVLSERMKNK